MSPAKKKVAVKGATPGKPKVEKVASGPGVFEFINDINLGKKNLIRGSENELLAAKLYSPFMTNRALSYFVDTVLYANDMNMAPGLDSQLQYEYLLHSIRRGKRFSKWYKPEKSEELELVSEHFKISMVRAREVHSLLSADQIRQIRDSKNTGGVAKK